MTGSDVVGEKQKCANHGGASIERKLRQSTCSIYINNGFDDSNISPLCDDDGKEAR